MTVNNVAKPSKYWDLHWGAITVSLSRFVNIEAVIFIAMHIIQRLPNSYHRSYPKLGLPVEKKKRCSGVIDNLMVDSFPSSLFNDVFLMTPKRRFISLGFTFLR